MEQEQTQEQTPVQTQELEQNQPPEQEPTASKSEPSEDVEETARRMARACWAFCMLVYILSGIFCGLFCGGPFGAAFENTIYCNAESDAVVSDVVLTGFFVGVLSCVALGMVAGTVIGRCVAMVRGAFKHWLKCGFLGALFGAVLGVLLVLPGVCTGRELPDVMMTSGLVAGIGGGITCATLGCLRYCTVKFRVWNVVTTLLLSLALGVGVCVMASETSRDLIPPDVYMMPVCILSFAAVGAMVCAGFGLQGAKKGAIWGSLVGLATGPIIGMVVSSFTTEPVSAMGMVLNAVLGVALGALCGLVVGAGIASGFAARVGWLSVICVLFSTVIVPLLAIEGQKEPTPMTAILCVTFLGVLGAMYSALLALKAGPGSLLGPRRMDFGIMLGLIVGVWMITPLAFIIAAAIAMDMMVPLSFFIIFTGMSIFGWCICAGLGGLITRKFGVGVVYGAWFGGLSILAACLLRARSYEIDEPGATNTMILLLTILGMVAGAALGALLGKPSDVECGDNAP